MKTSDEYHHRTETYMKSEKGKLFIQACGKFFSGLLLAGLLLFIPAGTIHYWNAWLLIGILFVPMFIAGIAMLFRSPDLLRKRLNARENESEQKQVIAWSGLMFLAAFILAGLNFRFKWIVMPDWLVWLASTLGKFNANELRRADYEVHDIADGRYDGLIQKFQQGMSR